MCVRTRVVEENFQPFFLRMCLRVSMFARVSMRVHTGTICVCALLSKSYAYVWVIV